MKPEIIIYSTARCPYCVQAKALLKQEGVDFTEIFIDQDDEKRDEMIAKSNRYTVPQIFINGQHVGGFDDLYALKTSGQLKPLLNI
tara:strand:+ start:57 stop:314 length:258 start_codon:yes stop_codon:yes gene_type:complete